MELHYLNKSRTGELSNTTSSHAREGLSNTASSHTRESLSNTTSSHAREGLSKSGSELHSALEQHKSLVRSLRAEKRDLEAKYDESRMAILSLRAETCKLLSENKSLKLLPPGEHTLGDRCTTLLSENAPFKDRCTTLLSENATLKDKCLRLKEKRAMTVSEHATLQSENLALRDKCVSLLSENKTLRQAPGGAGGLKDKCASLLSENKTLRQEHQELLQRCVGYQSAREADTHRIQTLVDAMGGVHTLLDTLAEAGVAPTQGLGDSQRFIRKIVSDVTREE